MVKLTYTTVSHIHSNNPLLTISRLSRLFAKNYVTLPLVERMGHFGIFRHNYTYSIYILVSIQIDRDTRSFVYIEKSNYRKKGEINSVLRWVFGGLPRIKSLRSLGRIRTDSFDRMTFVGSIETVRKNGIEERLENR